MQNNMKWQQSLINITITKLCCYCIMLAIHSSQLVVSYLAAVVVVVVDENWDNYDLRNFQC